MKVVILAGGYGSRLGTITELIPKPMVKIGNRPILWHIMKYYASFGYNEFVLSLGYKAEVVKEFFYNYETEVNDFTIDLGSRDIDFHGAHDEADWKVTLIDTGVDTLKGARIKRTEQFLDDVNFLTYGDGLADVDIKELIEFHKSHGKILTITGVHPPARFGEIVAKDGKVTAFQEKKQTSAGRINGGFMVFNKNLLEYLSDQVHGDLEFEVFPKLAAKGEMMVYDHIGHW
ncbi:MAG TPA: sugar phosphate nucleotidyltransferase, partial [Candidatus Bathyarchaeia archaeon]|nr:sugar phosphate nucleotidyltransferase [Candidatus Bathyarchaeia archaeon]